MTARARNPGITRRHFVNGAAAGLAGTALTSGFPSPLVAAQGSQPVRSGAAIRHAVSDATYPPVRGGLRGSHPESNVVAHKLALEGQQEWGSATQSDSATYDLVVVGGGLSGLSAAHFYRKRQPGARVLILDNHDDFGGHARRNEFELDGRLYLGMGGSEGIAVPLMTDPMAELFEDIAVDLEQLAADTDQDFFARHGLSHVFFFDKETYGVDMVVAGHIPQLLQFPIPESPTRLDIDQMPLSAASKRELFALYRLNEDRTDPGMFGEFDYLNGITYEDFLTRHGGITQPELISWFRPSTIVSGMYADSAPAIQALGMGWPGLGATSYRLFRHKRLPQLFRLLFSDGAQCPDGNATVARMLVRHLIPAVSDGGETMASVVTAPFDYSKLDLPNAEVRLRLESTAVNVRHDGDPHNAETVSVTYVRGDRTEVVQARHCVLACWNSAIPYIWQELPEAQSQALSQATKLPMVLTNVLLRNWRAFEAAGIGAAYCPGHLHTVANFACECGFGDGYGVPASADEPAVLFMRGVPRGWGAPDPRNRAETGRYEMMGRTFDDYEKDVRRMLNGMVGAWGFDFDRDVAALTVNQWPHGYAQGPSPVFDPKFAEGQAPFEIGRAPLGRVAIANSDAEALALMQGAIDQAYRAVGELAG